MAQDIAGVRHYPTWSCSLPRGNQPDCNDRNGRDWHMSNAEIDRNQATYKTVGLPLKPVTSLSIHRASVSCMLLPAESNRETNGTCDPEDCAGSQYRHFSCSLSLALLSRSTSSALSRLSPPILIVACSSGKDSLEDILILQLERGTS